ncbi:hypothetical protein [Streptomyces sp. NPDC046821]|uniref:hypothetical protein n=1 Tax=Streptomyces sp. NPDC046821 TaxID=3154702 RepID=UPI0034024586
MAAAAPAAGEPASQASANTVTTRTARVDLAPKDPYTTKIMGDAVRHHSPLTTD